MKTTTINGMTFDYDKSLELNECFTNKTNKPITAKVKYVNAFGLYQVDNRKIDVGNTIQLTNELNRIYIIL